MERSGKRESVMSRRTKKVAQKREHPVLEQPRPAGIQAMDPKLYEHIQQAIRGLEECRG
jgi:hypothetical protein